MTLKEAVKRSDKLKTPEFIEFLNKKLEVALNHPLISQQRILLPYESYYDYEEESEQNFSEYKKIPRVQIGYEIVKDKIKPVYQKIHFGLTTHYKDRYEIKNSYSKKICSSPYLFHDGVISGGALTALANEYIFGVPAIINDIDYFYFSNFKSKTDQDVYEDVYESLSERDEEFAIKKSSKEGILNFIKIEIPDTEKIWTKLMSFFDLNCCMIAFHPTTKQLIITEAFENYINNHLIEHSGSDLNFTNIIRAKRKSQELNTKYYLGDAVRKLILKDLNYSSVSQEWEMTSYLMEKREIPVISRNKYSSRFVAAKDYAFVENNIDLLLPYFTFNPNNKTFKFLGQMPLVSFYQEYIFQKGSWLKYRHSKESNWFIVKNLLQLINPKYPKEEVPTKYYKRLLMLMQGFATLDIKIAQNEFEYRKFELYIKFLKQDVDKHQFFSLLEKIKGHERCLGLVFSLLQLDWSFSDVFYLISRVSNKPKEYFGLLEEIFRSIANKNSQHSSIKVGNQNYYINLKTSPDNILLKLDEIYNNILDSKNIKLREKTTLRLMDQFIRELTTGSELINEGSQMKHCVGGLASRVANQTSRFFHLDYKNHQTTLELRIQSSVWILGEHKGFQNKNPSSLSRQFATIFINYINLYKL